MNPFQDWVFDDISELSAALDYELEHPDWQYDWYYPWVMKNQFPALIGVSA